MKLSSVLRGKAIRVGALATGLIMSGCASTTSLDDPDAVYDPIEPVNRYVFEVNYFLDEMFIKPSAYIYRAALPDPAQRGVRNALSNLRMPWTAINDLLQGEFDRAAVAGGRRAAAGHEGWAEAGAGRGWDRAAAVELASSERLAWQWHVGHPAVRDVPVKQVLCAPQILDRDRSMACVPVQIRSREAGIGPTRYWQARAGSTGTCRIHRREPDQQALADG